MTTNISVEGSAQARCIECGGTFAAGDMIRHGNAYVCANCKPIFMQKLAEGAEIGAGMHYAGFWLRFAAFFLDSIIVGIVNAVIQVVAVFSMTQSFQQENPSVAPLVISYCLSMAIAISYEGIMVGKYGATIGKMACKIKIVAGDGAPVSYGRAFGRYFAKLLSSLTLLIGFIIAAFDEQKRSLHDRICNTRVIAR